MSARGLTSIILYTAVLFLLAYPMVGSISGAPARYVVFRDAVDISRPTPPVAKWARLRSLGLWSRPVAQFAAWDPDKPAGSFPSDMEVVEDGRSGKMLLVPAGGGNPQDPTLAGASLVSYPVYVRYLELSSAQRPGEPVVVKEGVPYMKDGAGRQAKLTRLLRERDVARLARTHYGKPDGLDAMKRELASRPSGKLLADGLRGVCVAPDPLPYAVLLAGVFFAASIAWEVTKQRRLDRPATPPDVAQTTR